MAEQTLTIDHQTIEDNTDLLHVEFEADLEDDRLQFAVQYSVLEALSGDIVGDEAGTVFKDHADQIAEAALNAVMRDPDADMILITESDIEDV